MAGTKDLLKLLLRRDDVLAQLRDGPVDIRTLTEAVDVSRPTVHRSLKELVRADLVVETREGYELTTYGTVVYEKYRTNIAGFADIRENKDLLSSLEAACAFPFVMLEGATFTHVVPFAPEKPIEAVEDIVRGATKLRGFSPVIIGRYVSLFHEQVTAGSLDAEIIISEEVHEYISGRWPEQLGETVDAGLDYLVTADELPFGLVVVEEPTPVVCVVIYDDGTLRGVITNRGPAVLEWAEGVYEHHHGQAASIDLTANGDAS